MRKEPTVRVVACSFCGADRKHVQRLIAGPAVYICDQCVGLCVDIMAGEKVEGDSLKLHGSTQTIADLRAQAETAERMAKRMYGHATIAIRSLLEAIGKSPDELTTIRCMWCDAMLADRREAREHTATCEQHPAVQELARVSGGAR